ncbi:hypothetical protein Hanom_Chr05g00402761 [Helianthus anomalus]
MSLVLKSERRTKATRSKIEARSAKRWAFRTRGTRCLYIFFYISHTYPIGF